MHDYTFEPRLFQNKFFLIVRILLIYSHARLAQIQRGADTRIVGIYQYITFKKMPHYVYMQFCHFLSILNISFYVFHEHKIKNDT
jgi:hypothetical protein